MEHDLKISESVVINMALNKAKLKTIYKVLREQERFHGMGDYPLVSWITRVVKEIREVTKGEILKALRVTEDGEFKDLKSNNKLITQL